MNTSSPISSQAPHNPLPVVLQTVLAAWLLAIVVLTLADTFSMPPGTSPTPLLLALVIPIAVYLIAYARIHAFRSWILGVDLRVLIIIHSLRVVGMSFVFLYCYDQLPPLFAFPAGLGDATAAIGALILGISLYSGITVSRRTVWGWNLFGVFDFIIAVGTGIASRPGGIADFGAGVTSAPMGEFPLAMIPGFFVPLYLIAHLAIMNHLRTHWQNTATICYSAGIAAQSYT